jgi:bifunctional UDP-N-acetylglucosamine pyrophosphorylase / glucosamine-1-phosphate N-acetyltransferase
MRVRDTVMGSMPGTSSIVIILAAGLGTRMKSERAKVLHEVAGRPLIGWAVDTARAAGADRVIAVLGHQLERVQQVLGDRYGAGVIGVAHQREQRGTGHAVMSALPALDSEPGDRIVLITSADAPLLPAKLLVLLTEACERSPADLALVSARMPRPMPYGRLLRGDDGEVVRIVEHADASPEERRIEEINAGFYAIRLGRLREDIASLTSDNAQGELYLTDLVERAAARGPVGVIEADYDEVAGVNDRVDLAAVEAIYQRRIRGELMREGVTLTAPEQTFVDADAGPVGRDVWIGPNVHIRGRTRLGDGCHIDAGCVLSDATLGARVRLGPHSVVEGAVIGDDVVVGPFAHLDAGTRVEEGARVGSFVRAEGAQVMAGAEASHHTYLAQATVGRRAFVGAGTITSHYDGVATHRSVIEEEAFIGADTQLVAPVTVGRGAYVGSGTTVTRDVPRAALALSRVRQVKVEGWADRFREAKRRRAERRRS